MTEAQTMTTATTPDLAERILRAAEWADHVTAADRYAAARTGYTWDVATFISFPAIAADVLATSEYARLEAGARERRILAFAACLSPAT